MARTRADWHWEDIKAAVRKRGTTMADLSRGLGYCEQAVRQIKFTSFPNAQAGVARFLGVAPQEIWPSRYDPDGRPLRKRRSDTGKPKPRCSAETPQKQDAV